MKGDLVRDGRPLSRDGSAKSRFCLPGDVNRTGRCSKIVCIGYRRRVSSRLFSTVRDRARARSRAGRRVPYVAFHSENRKSKSDKESVRSARAAASSWKDNPILEGKPHPGRTAPSWKDSSILEGQPHPRRTISSDGLVPASLRQISRAVLSSRESSIKRNSVRNLSAARRYQ